MNFDDLAKLESPHQRFSGNITTPFWEELYQLFKARMEEEQSNKQSDVPCAPCKEAIITSESRDGSRFIASVSIKDNAVVSVTPHWTKTRGDKG